MSLYRMLVAIRKKFGSSRRNFFWDGNSKRRMLHLMCWNEVIKPKHASVLGLGSLDVKNWARFAKMVVEKGYCVLSMGKMNEDGPKNNP